VTGGCLSVRSMDHPALARIEQAIERIEAAIARRRVAAEAVAERHAALKSRMAEAVAALDAVMVREGAE